MYNYFVIILTFLCIEFIIKSRILVIAKSNIILMIQVHDRV